MKRTLWTGLGVLALVATIAGLSPLGQTIAAQSGGTTAHPVPQLQVDPAWPKIPA
jgi:hypothetical protein